MGMPVSGFTLEPPTWTTLTSIIGAVVDSWAKAVLIGKNDFKRSAASSRTINQRANCDQGSRVRVIFVFIN